MTDAVYMSREKAANYIVSKGIPCTKNSLQKFASVGGGPVYRRFGNKSLYLAADLDLWIEKRLSAPLVSTSQAA